MKPFVFELNSSGVCTTCNKKIAEEKIKCSSCDKFFHATCSPTDPTDPICTNKAFLKSFINTSASKFNFSWACDHCLTLSENDKVALMSEQISSLRKAVTQLSEDKTRSADELKVQMSQEFMLLTENIISDIKARITDQVTQQMNTRVMQELEKLTASQSAEFDKLSASISTKTSDHTPSSTGPVWKNPQSDKDLRASIMVKPDEHGNPIDPGKIKKIILENGVPVNKITVSSSGDTFINLPNLKSREKLQPLLERHHNDHNILLLKKKLPQFSILGVTDDLSKDDIKNGLISQNEAISTLVNAGHELSVVYTRPPPQGKAYHQVTVRVSPEIRRAIKASGNKVHLIDRHCRVIDNFHIKRCNKCQSYGHYASKCKPDSQDICGYCGEHHKSSECLLRNNPSHTHKCCNCELAGLENSEGHSTFWKDCPAYKIQQDKLKGAISYDYSLN
jgi:hypothetical protein